jgi:hypothetical protein
MPRLFIALELGVDTGNLSKIEEAIKEGFEVKWNGSWLFLMVVPVPNLTVAVLILEGDFVVLLNFITSNKTISS